MNSRKTRQRNLGLSHTAVLLTLWILIREPVHAIAFYSRHGGYIFVCFVDMAEDFLEYLFVILFI